MSEADDFNNVSIIIYDGGSTSEEIQEEEAKTSSKPIPMRLRSLSYSAPVTREAYESLPQSPASKFLSELVAHRDDTFGLEGFEEGRVIRNYLVGPLIGEGGFSECRQAYVINRAAYGTKTNLPERISMKIITDPRCFKDFEAEVGIWQRLKHPNILPMIDYFAGPNYRVAISPYIEGGNLQEYLVQRGKLEESTARGIFKQICEAVHYLHTEARIAHLDIKLENVLIGGEDDTSVLLCDFGMSYWADDPKRKRRRFVPLESNDMFCSGSLTSLPPEVLSSEASSASECSDTESFVGKLKQDIWALGILLYALVCGKLPFYDDFIPRLQHSIITGTYSPPPESLSQEVRDVISQLLHRNSYERPDISNIKSHSWLKNNK